MHTSPCLNCNNLTKDKSNPECTNCRQRLVYVQNIGDLITTKPIKSIKADQIATLTPKKEVKMETEKPIENSPEMRICKICKIPKPLISDFHKRFLNADGVMLYESQCKKCRAQNQKEYEKRVKALRKQITSLSEIPISAPIPTPNTPQQTVTEKPRESMAEKRTCRTCNQAQPLAKAYHKTRVNSDGILMYETECKRCKQKKQHEQKARVRAMSKMTTIDKEELKPSDQVPKRGPKDTTDKIDWSVFPFAEAQEVVRVFEYGVQKYGKPFTYRDLVPINELFAAIMRHAIAIQAGQNIDHESGLHHAGHICCNALMILSHYQK